MPNERIADLRIIPIEFPQIVQLEWRALDADKQPYGPPITDPSEKWTELKRRLFLDEGTLAAAVPILERGQPYPLGIQRVTKP
jgi:hypothetical protein